MSAEVIKLLQEAEAAFRGLYSMPLEPTRHRAASAHNAVYLALRKAGVDPLPHR